MHWPLKSVQYLPTLAFLKEGHSFFINLWYHFPEGVTSIPFLSIFPRPLILTEFW